MVTLIIVLLLGGIIGLISGFLGLGGGILIVPLLPFVLKVPQQQIIGTSLFCIFFVVTLNTWSFHKKNLVSWPVVLLMGPVTGIMAFVAGQLALGISQEALKWALAGTLGGVVVWTLLRKTPTVLKGKVDSGVMKVADWGYLLAWSLLAGALSGLTGIGSGMVLGACMLNLKIINNEKLSPTSNAIMVFTTSLGAIVFLTAQKAGDYFGVGLVHLDIAFFIVVGAVVTSAWARNRQHLLMAQKRKAFLLALLGLLFLKTTISALGFEF